MIILMALAVFFGVMALGGVTPELALPSFALVSLMGLLWAGRLVSGSATHWKRSPINWPAAVFLVYAIGRYILSPIEYDARIELFQIGACVLIYFIAVNHFHHRFDRQVFLWTLMALAVFQSSYGLWQVGTNSDAVFGWERPDVYRGRASGTYICPNHMAGFLEMALAMILAHVVVTRRSAKSLERSVLAKVGLAYVALMALLGIAFSFSRAGWITTFLGLLLLFGWGMSARRASWMKYSIATLIVVVLLGLAWSMEPIRNRLLGSFSPAAVESQGALKDPSLGGRTYMWAGTLKILKEYPVFGSGGGSWQWLYQKYRHHFLVTHSDYAHNDILQLASDYGLVGFGIMLAVFIGFFRHAYWLSRPAHPSEIRAFAIGAIVAVTVLLIHSWFDFNMHIPANAILLAAILGFTAAIPEREERYGRINLTPAARFSLAAGLLLFIGIGGWFYARTAVASLFVDLGQTAKSQLGYDAALNYFSRAQALDPKSPRPWLRTGDTYRSQSNWRLGPEKLAERTGLARQAIDAYLRSLQLNPYQSEAHLGLGRAYALAREPDNALKHLLLATELDPSNSYAHYTLGSFYRDRGELQKAEESLRRSQALLQSTATVNTLLDLQERMQQSQTPDQTKPTAPQ